MVENPGGEFLGSEIQKATSISRAGVYIALRELIRQGLVFKTQKGKFLIYYVAYNDPVIRQFKIMKNIISLRPVISRLKSLSKKIILYGSSSRGEDSANSDIDLFVLSGNPDAIKNIFASIKMKRKLQAVIKSPSEWADLKDKDKVFYDEVDRGIILWEESE